MQAKDFPVTTPYGQVAGYPLHNGFHQGIDYGCPVGSPVMVNGVLIGLSGNTGYTFGPHLHLGKWLNGVVQDPLNGGFLFNSAVVTEVGEDSTNGKFIRVQGDGASWVYLHLSRQDVKVGQILKGGTMTLSPHYAGRAVKACWGHDITPAELAAYTKVDELTMLKRILDDPQTDTEFARVKALEANTAPPTVLKPGNYQVH